MKDEGTNAKNVSDGKHPSHDSHSSYSSDRLLPPRGDYQTLLSLQKAEIAYDLTFRFAHKYLSKGDRLEKDFLEQRGLREHMTRARLAYWNKRLQQ